MSEVQGGKGAAVQSVSMEVMTFKKLKTDFLIHLFFLFLITKNVYLQMLDIKIGRKNKEGRDNIDPTA